MSKRQGKRIFVSYASEWTRLAARISNALKLSDHQVYFDRESMRGGEDYQRRVHKEIDGSELFVFLISPESVEKGCYARSELHIAQRKWPNPKNNVLPVLACPTDLELIPAYLTAVSIFDPPGDLAEAVRSEVDHWEVMSEVDMLAHIESILGDLPPDIPDWMKALGYHAYCVGNFKQEVVEKGEPHKTYRRKVQGKITADRRLLWDEETEYHAEAGREYTDDSGYTCRDVTTGHMTEDGRATNTHTFHLVRGNWEGALRSDKPSSSEEQQAADEPPTGMTPIRHFR